MKTLFWLLLGLLCLPACGTAGLAGKLEPVGDAPVPVDPQSPAKVELGKKLFLHR